MAVEVMSDVGNRVITDTKGRRLAIRDLDVVEQLDLYEMAGANSTNSPWLGTAMMVCTVRWVDDWPQPFPKTRDQLRAALGRLGREGVDALHADLSAQREALEVAAGGEGEAPESDAASKTDAAKN